ncbi:MAG: FAD-binding oxidoreductase [Succinivibrio sp.]|nr:FAD-binding oxidoreductase [Succinivibrio sp.]
MSSKEQPRIPQLSGRNPWFELSARKNEHYAALEALKESYDYVVIGAGFTGLSAARRLIENEPGARVAVFEALAVGQFSSGRNAGILCPEQLTGVLIGRSNFTADDQKWLLSLNSFALERIKGIVEGLPDQGGLGEEGLYRAVREARNSKILDTLQSRYAQAGIRVERLKGSALEQKLGTAFYRDALFVPHSYSCNPAHLVRSVAACLPPEVQLFENTPVLRVSDGTPALVTLRSGQVIRARKVLFTVSAFLKEFGVAPAARLSAIHSYATVTRPLKPEEAPQLYDAKPWAVTAVHPCGATVRLLPDKRLFLRTVIDFARHQNVRPERLYRAQQAIRRALKRRFPELMDIESEFNYGGLVSFTANARPVFAQVGQSSYAAATCDGSGVLRGTFLGAYLADLAQGRGSRELEYLEHSSTPAYLPPEPWRSLGAAAFLRYRTIQAGSES